VGIGSTASLKAVEGQGEEKASYKAKEKKKYKSIKEAASSHNCRVVTNEEEEFGICESERQDASYAVGSKKTS